MCRDGPVRGHHKVRGEVPSDRGGVGDVFQVFVQQMGLPTIDFNLFHHLELYPLFLYELLDFLGAARFLLSKLIARKGQNLNLAGIVGVILYRVVQFNQPVVMRLGISTIARNVNDNQNLIPECVKGDRVTVNVIDGKVVDRFDRRQLLLFQFKRINDRPT